MGSDSRVCEMSDVHSLFVAHAADLHRYAARRVGRDLADDVVAETFRQAIESFPTFDAAQGSARGWLFGISTNLLRRHWRTEKRRLQALARSQCGSADHQSDPFTQLIIAGRNARRRAELPANSVKSTASRGRS